MRLRLVVRRHGIPDANILWNSKGLHAIPQGNSSEPTIAQFLLQVNEVVPLESEDWGLEDYIVEVGGFECVHFSPLESVLKDNDQVLIRPLELNDRRFRRVSGRIQIAADGRRLYDGVVFGRPFLRRSIRPPVRIPSAKRARVTYSDKDEDEDADRPIEPNQLILREDDSGEDDSDYDQELTSEEIAALAADSVRNGEAGPASLQRFRGTNVVPYRKTGLGIKAVGISPSTTTASSSSRLRPRQLQGQRVSSGTIKDSPKIVRFETDELDTPATILDADETDEDDDDYDSDNESEDSAADKENVAPAQQLSDTGIVAGTSETFIRSESDLSESTSSSGSDSSESEDSGDLSEADSDDTSSVSSSDSTDDLSSVEKVSTVLRVKDVSSTKAKTRQNNSLSSDVPATGHQTANGVLHTTSQNMQIHQVVPYRQGSTATRKRNARRKRLLQAERTKESQALDTHAQGMGLTTNSRPCDDQNHMDGQTINGLESRRSKSLGNLVKMDYVQSTRSEESALERQQPEIKSSTENDDINIKPMDAKSEEKQSASKRSKLDLGSAKRMLFASLGLRAPKSKEDADRLRDKLGTEAQKLPGNLIGPVQPSKTEMIPVSAQIYQNDESWKDSIDLRAVECCYDGVEYSAPPFPFVQRWDPQQQYSNKRTSKGPAGRREKRQKRNNEQYYQGFDDQRQHSYGYYGNSSMQESYDNQIEGSATFDGKKYSNSNVQNEQNLQAANDQLLVETETAAAIALDEDKFPELPADVSSLAAFNGQDAIVGNIIVFKQMEMSELTSWSPVISNYKTARIEDVSENGVLSVLLAPRDVPMTEKRYDPDTGERLYSKFEMPDEDEDEDEDEETENRGYLEIAMEDMIDAKLLEKRQKENEGFNRLISMENAMESIKKILPTGKQVIGAFLATAETDNEAGSHSEIETGQNVHGVGHLNAQGGNEDQEEIVEAEAVSLNRMDEKETPAREASVELGSHEPPQRFFSESRGSPVSKDTGKAGPKFHENYPGDATVQTPKTPTSIVISFDGANDDPSLWHHSSDNKDLDETRFFSPLPPRPPQQYSSSHTKQSALDSAPVVEEHLVIERNETDEEVSNSASNSLPTVIAAGDADEDPADLGEQDEALERTLAEDTSGGQSTVHKSDKPSGEDVGHKSDSDSDFDSASGSSSLMSLKDLLLPPVNLINPPRLRSGRRGKSNYPKIPATLPDLSDAIVFSQAPRRVISDTQKIVIDPDSPHYALSSADQTGNGPHELDSYSDEPRLPELSAAAASPSTSMPSFSSPARESAIVDLTGSSDPVAPMTMSEDENDSTPRRKQPVRKAASSMSSGPGWVGKNSVNGKSTGKSKTSRRNVRRNDDLA